MTTAADMTLAAGTFGLVAAMGWALLAAWRDASRDPAPPPILRAFARLKVDAHRFEGEFEMRQLAEAMRRCAFCRRKAECRAELETADGRGFLRFCPNAEFFARNAPH
jgi:hypothetical protein